MLKKLLAVILILLGICAVIVGVWGLSLQGTELPQWVTDFVDKALGYMGEADKALTDATGKSTAEYVLALSDGEIDLNDKLTVWFFVYQHAVSIILAGIVGVETGMLLWIFSNRR